MKAAADEGGQVISVEVQPDGGPWLPADEHFEPGKQTGFVWQAVLADLPAVSAMPVQAQWTCFAGPFSMCCTFHWPS